jgi:hypothetical protein
MRGDACVRLAQDRYLLEKNRGVSHAAKVESDVPVCARYSHMDDPWEALGMITKMGSR